MQTSEPQDVREDDTTEKRQHVFGSASVKKAKFERTADILAKSGLLDVTMKTADLIRKNQQLQNEITDLKSEASDFVKSVLANPENQKLLAKSTNVAISGTKFQNESPKFLMNPDNQKYMSDSSGMYLNAEAQDIQSMLGSDGAMVNDGGMSRNLDGTNHYHSESLQNSIAVESVPSPKVSVIKLAGSNSNSRLGTPLSDLHDN